MPKQVWESRPGAGNRRHKEARSIQDSGVSTYLGHGPRGDSGKALLHLLSETAQPHMSIL